MKKLLSVFFMALLAVSAFATVNVETETSLSVYHDGSCERVGSFRFIVTNNLDYSSASSTNPVYIKIQLRDAAVLCRDIDGDYNEGTTDLSDGNYWIDAEVDNETYGWQTGDVKVRGARGDDYIEVIILDAPVSPDSQNQAWFRFGSTLGIDGLPITLNAYGDPNNADDYTTPAGAKEDGTPICVDYTGRVNGVDAFQENDVNRVAIETYQGSLDGPSLGISYSPADPAIAYGGPENAHNFTTTVGNKGDFSAETIYLCDCYTSDTDQNDDGTYTTTYDCHCVYRFGHIAFDDAELSLLEDAVGMLPANSTITMTVVDGEGNPLSTVDHGVYFTNTHIPSLTVDGTSGLTLTSSTPTAYDYGTGNPYDVDSNYHGWDDGDDDTCPDGYNSCGTSGQDLYTSYEWTVATPSVAAIGQIAMDQVDVARNSCDDPIDAYIKVSWTPYPCGSGGSIVLYDYPIHFVACPSQPEVVYSKAVAYEYFSYFPDFSWWSGLAITNVTYFYDNYIGNGDNQDITATLYLIEEDGDIYTLDAGTVPASGIKTYLLSGLPTAPTLVSGTDSAFGDERFWVIVEAESTQQYATENPDWFTIFIDGFGMMGDGTQAQGFLPRVFNGGNWMFPTYLKK